MADVRREGSTGGARAGAPTVAPRPFAEPPRRILVLRYRFIGDTLLAVPFLRALRRAAPAAEIEVLVAPGSGELLQGCPYVDALHWYTRRRPFGGAEPRFVHRTWFDALGALRRRRYDAVYVLKRAWSSAVLARMVGAPRRIGLDVDGRAMFLTDAVPPQSGVHETESHLALLRATGFDAPADRRLESFVRDDERAAVDAAWRATAPRTTRHVGVQASASDAFKNWPSERFVELIDGLDRAFDGDVAFHAVGGPGDVAANEALRRALPRESLRGRWTDWSRRLDLRAGQALMERLDLVVGSDSGPLHLAASAGTPAVAVFGPMDPARWAPTSPGSVAVALEGLECRPCGRPHACRIGRRCLSDLGAAPVLAECVARLSGARRAV
ncbi:MAG TPA: glycosyltransferase family 9 protein [Planctomycetota bacterium]|nr:glycosyltransferase family 9 protein [Planctomycetota bacterium]